MVNKRNRKKKILLHNCKKNYNRKKTILKSFNSATVRRKILYTLKMEVYCQGFVKQKSRYRILSTEYINICITIQVIIIGLKLSIENTFKKLFKSDTF